MRVGLILSGALAKGAYEIGALKAISEFLTPGEISYLSTASVGAVIGYAYVCDRLDFAEESMLALNKKQSKVFVKSVMSSGFFDQIVTELAAQELNCKRFYTSLLSLNHRKCCYLNLTDRDEKERYQYLKATMAFIPLVKPVKIGSDHFIDGAFVDNIPIYPLRKHKLDYVICIHFDKHEYTFESPSTDSRIIKIVFNEDKELLSKSLWITRERTEQMLEDGYKRAKQILNYVFAEGTDALDTIYERIGVLNSIRPIKENRVTGDIVINNLSKFTRTLTKAEVLD